MAKRARRRTGASMLKSLLLGWAVMLAFGVLLLLLLTALALGAKDPIARVTPYATVALVLLSLTGGFASAAFYRKRGLLIGFITGAGLSALLLIGSLLGEGGQTAPGMLLSYLLVLMISTLGGLLGGAKPKRRRRPR